VGFGADAALATAGEVGTTINPAIAIVAGTIVSIGAFQQFDIIHSAQDCFSELTS